MRPVADIPPGDDADDELSGITPELVLVDPELARLVRERETPLNVPVAPSPSRSSPLRLVRALESETAIVPRPAPSSSEPSRAEAPEPPPPVVRREPTPTVERPRHPIPPPLAEPVRRSPAPARMPVHPARSRRRWRRMLALLGGVAAASLAVLGVLQLTDGPSETAQTVAGPQALGEAPGLRLATPKPTRAVTKAGVSTATPRRVATSPPEPKEPQPPAAVRSNVSPLTPGAKTNGAQPTTPRQPPHTSGKSSVAPLPSTAPAVRRFAWAPVEGATGYHVELFRGAVRVLARETKQPVLALGRTWRYGGRTVSLTPGAYRWYVWAVTKRGRASAAVVQATLTV
jgi:hypothetical protein